MKSNFFHLVVLIIACSVMGSFTYGQTVSPSLHFTNSTLTSGTAGHQGAVYKFANVITGIDAFVTISSLNGGASLAALDQTSNGYGEAWQPVVNSAAHATSYIEWKIRFKKAGTQTDTILPLLSITAVDVDGDSVSIKEFVSAKNVSSYYTWPTSNLTISNNAPYTKAVSAIANINNIDTSQKQAMIQLNYTNINEVTYQTGSVSTGSGNIGRQHCLYFKSFVQSMALPIQLVQFDAQAVTGRKVALSWMTASEMNNDYFIIERSSDALTFEPLAELDAAGNSLELLNYSFADVNPLSGKSYYRLKQTDYDGHDSYSTVRMVELTNAGTLLSVFPNPATTNVIIQFTPAAINLHFNLFNAAGKREIISSYSEDDKIILDTSHLIGGTYFLQIENNSKTEMRQIIVE